MDGKQEQSSTDGSKIDNNIFPVVENEEESALNPLVSKLAQIRANNNTRRDKLSQLLDITVSSEERNTFEQIPYDLIPSQVAELSQSELSPAEYLLKGKQLLISAEQARKKITDELATTETEYLSNSEAINTINTKLTELNRSNGLKRMMSIFDKKRLNQQIEQLERKVKENRTHSSSQRQSVDQVGTVENSIRQKQQEVILSEASSEIRAVKADYETFLEEVFQDGSISREIQDAYINDVITPLVDKSQIPPDKREAFYASLKNYLQDGTSSEKERQAMLGQIHTIISEHEFYYIRNACQSLLNGQEREIITRLVGLVAASDMTEIKSAVSSKFNEDFGNQLENALNFDDDFGKVIVSALKRNGKNNYPDMTIWEALRSSTTAEKLFGDVIRIEDERIYNTALTKSLTDLHGEDIDMLVYYPRPEAIRNLIILAAAESKNYRTIHANQALSILAKKSNWQDILDQAEQVYPTLKTSRQILDNWKYDFPDNNPGVQVAIQDFAASFLEDEQQDKTLTDLAIESLSNSFLLEDLYKKGVIPEIEIINALKEVTIVLENIENDINNITKDCTYYVIADSFRNVIRRNLFNLIHKQVDEAQISLDSIKRLATLAQSIVASKTDYSALAYLSDIHLIKKMEAASISDEDITILLSAYKECPALISNKKLLGYFCDRFEGAETVSFFKDASIAFDGKEEQLVQIIKIVGDGVIDHKRALELPNKASDILISHVYHLACEYPNLYLATDTDVDFFRKMTEAYQNNDDIFKNVSRITSEGKLSRELASAFPQQASALMKDTMKEVRSFVLFNTESLIKDGTDLKFLNTIVGEFGKKSDIILKGYLECLQSGTITTAEKDLVLEFVRQFRVVSPLTLGGYKEAKEARHEKVYIAQLTSIAEKLTGAALVTDQERAKPYFKDLIKHVYSNNSGQWSNFESNDSCSDRNSDLSEFNIKPRYELDLLSQSEIKIKNGEELDTEVQEEVQKPIYAVWNSMNEKGFDYPQIKADLGEVLENRLNQIVAQGGLEGLNLDSVSTPEERLFLILTDSIYGSRTFDSQVIKNLLITYEFANYEDITEYIAGTNDRVSRASNQDYALLCEVGAFYSDRIKEVNRMLIEKVWKNPEIAKLMPEYFKKIAQETVSEERKDKINRLQVDRLGSSDTFIRQVKKTLEKRRGKKYELDDVRKIIQRYETATGGLTEKESASNKPLTRAFYGQLRSQREKTIEAVRQFTGEDIDPAKVHLGELDLQQILDAETSIREGKYDEDEFASYTVQRFIDLFEDEKIKIEGELDKFESTSGKQREVLHGYITKTKESAHARMVGGVCVAGDNPAKNSNRNIWDMPNYFQLVLQEPDTLQCQGVVLLHHFNENGRKVLAASLNPSSTYLYSVDENALFSGIMGSLEQFASENGFDVITFSRNKAIRTNRTGGQFEKAMNEKISQVSKTFVFDTPQQFSHHPNYQIQDMDVVWENIK